MIEKVKLSDPKILPKNYTQGIDNLSSEDFLKIYMETLKYQDPFQQQDLSKMLEDMVKLNQIRYMNYMEAFLEGLKGWLNQITLLESLNFLGKDFIFSADRIDTINHKQYYLISSEEIKDVILKIKDGQTIIKETKVNLSRGLNPIDLSDLPPGQFEVEFIKNGFPLERVSLGFQGKVRSVSIIGNDLLFELENGEFISPSRLIYAGGV